jgi:hypothetical protein
LGCFEGLTLGETMKIEVGVMIVKNNKAWGVVYEDGPSSGYGWVSPETGTLYDERSTIKPTDVTYQGSSYIKELKNAEVIKVVRRTQVEFIV